MCKLYSLLMVIYTQIIPYMSDKPVILFFQFELMSHFFRSLRLAKVLNPDYEVYMRHTDKYAYRIEKSGLKSFHCKDYNPKTSLEKLGKYDFSWLNQNELEAIFLEQVNSIKKYKPNLVIGDTSFTLKMAAEFTGVPYISIINGYFTKYYKFNRELSPSHPIYSYISWLPDAVLNPVVRYKESQNFKSILKEFNMVRVKYNLRNTSHYLEEIEGDDNIICDLPEVFPQNNLPDNFHFIGPLLNGTDKEDCFEIKKINPNKKTVFVTTGSSEDWERFEFLNKDEYSKYNIIIAGTGHTGMDAPFIIKAPFINFAELLPLVDLVICHGGNGTLYNALANKIPVLCLPSHPEQYWNVQRITDMGYGQSLGNINPDQYPDLIAKWIERKDKIVWALNFDAFSAGIQDKLIKEIAEKLISNQNIVS
jgi:UDP:flavonoid glycosyltransferase YjiC (YdhE family)